MGEIEKTEKASSIEVNRNAKGEHSFKIKFYFNEEEKAKGEVVGEIEDVMNDLKSRFK